MMRLLAPLRSGVGSAAVKSSASSKRCCRAGSGNAPAAGSVTSEVFAWGQRLGIGAGRGFCRWMPCSSAVSPAREQES